MKLRQGFTLMELLVVLLIIGILSTVALRTIDATRDRALFDQTANEMQKLAQAIVGNPDLTFDGRRVDFGYYGDMEELPPGTDLRALVENPTGTAAWHGPYVKLTMGGDTASYLYDAWGRRYTWNQSLATLYSVGNGKYPMTVPVVDDTMWLAHNTIAGTITDRDNAAPGEQSLTILTVRLYYNNPDAHGGVGYAMVTPDPSGYYEFSSNPPAGVTKWRVPIGTHKLVAYTPTESLVRYVTVIPRSKTVVDFKFSSSFWNKLRMVGSPVLTSGNDGFLIKVVNDQANEVKLNWLTFFQAPADGWMRNFHIDAENAGYPLADGLPGTGLGDTVHFLADFTIAPFGAQIVEIAFQDFKDLKIYPPGNPYDVRGKTFEFRFSDGSEITVNLP